MRSWTRPTKHSGCCSRAKVFLKRDTCSPVVLRSWIRIATRLWIRSPNVGTHFVPITLNGRNVGDTSCSCKAWVKEHAVYRYVIELYVPTGRRAVKSIKELAAKAGSETTGPGSDSCV
ncbi:unnamed protein product [Ixodes persulcatus]